MIYAAGVHSAALLGQRGERGRALMSWPARQENVWALEFLPGAPTQHDVDPTYTPRSPISCKRSS